MADLITPQEMADKLTPDGFSRSGPTAQTLSDPIADTPMMVTLDELRPYELDPRLTRNPLYDDIKASIRKRGLDSPPPITRRPGAEHYIIRNGGNTRLAILRELWSETKDERFFRIACLFRPWPERGEIIALTGHLAENELHGGLTFIERALGVEKSRELYEQENGKPLSQSELARRLAADGYPIQQSHISRMQDTVRYLLPAIPNVLYSGLGRHQVERLAVLRKAAELTWEKHAHGKSLNVDFEMLFHDVLALFDAQPEAFAVKRAQDELIGQMAGLLDADYNTLELEVDSIEHRQHAVNSPPSVPAEPSSTIVAPDAGSTQRAAPALRPNDAPSRSGTETVSEEATSPTPSPQEPDPVSTALIPAPTVPQQPDDETAERLQDHIVSPAASTERLQAIQQLVAEHTGESMPDFADNVLRAIPIQVGGLFPITDVWYIDPGLDSPDRLRIHIVQFAREIAEEADLADCIEPVDTGIGFVCTLETRSVPLFGRMILALLHALSVSHDIELPRPHALENFLLDDGIGILLLGRDARHSNTLPRLSDAGLVKCFRLLRLARRLRDLQVGTDEP